MVSSLQLGYFFTSEYNLPSFLSSLFCQLLNNEVLKSEMNIFLNFALTSAQYLTANLGEEPNQLQQFLSHETPIFQITFSSALCYHRSHRSWLSWTWASFWVRGKDKQSTTEHLMEKDKTFKWMQQLKLTFWINHKSRYHREINF